MNNPQSNSNDNQNPIQGQDPNWKEAVDPQRLKAGVRDLRAKFQKVKETTERLQLKRRVQSLRDYLQSIRKG